jgi:hypothetical protein
LNHCARSWINQNCVLIDDRVAVGWGNSIFRRHLVKDYKDYPGGRQGHPNLRILGIDKSGSVLAYHIVVKGSGSIDAQEAAKAEDPARDTANDATDRANHGPAYGAAFGCATFRAAGNSLSLGRDRRGEQRRNHGYSECFLHRHVISPRMPG